jgi:putative colanic acid biosynthesis UDP-glucose lipid carrier transferase
MAPMVRMTEASIIVLSLVAAHFVLQLSMDAIRILVALIAALIYILIGEPNGLFASWRGAPLRQEMLRVAMVWLITFTVAAFVIQSIFPPEMSFVIRELWAWGGISLFSLLTWRAGFRYLLGAFRGTGLNRRRVAIAPASSLGAEVGRTIMDMPQAGMKVAGWFDDRDPHGIRSPEIPADMVLGDLEELVAQAKDGKFDRVYLAFPLAATERVKTLIQRLADTTVSVYIVPDFFTFNLLNSRILNLGQFTAISVFELPYNETDWYIKRAFDIFFSLGFLLFAGIPMLIIAALVKITSPGPAIFKQKRYGIDGRAIEVWKFRSMRVMDNGAKVEQAKKGDSRITPLGAFLRKSSLDEFPQFINVLQGTMSVVGPRPHAIAHNEEYRSKIHGYMLRHKVKPGITGWAQVNGWRGETETLDKMERRIDFDLDYIRKWSLWMDVKICAMTFWQLAFKPSRNAY